MHGLTSLFRIHVLHVHKVQHKLIKNQVRDTILKEQKDLSVLRNGAPDCPVHQGRTLRTSHSWESQGVLRYNSPHCPVSQRSNGYLRQWSTAKVPTTVNSVTPEVRAGSQRGTGLSGAARRQSSNGRLSSEP
jgi:hypothetical protein